LHTAKVLTTIAAISVFIIGTSTYANRILKNDAQSLEEKINHVQVSTKNEDWNTAESGLTSILEEWPKVEGKWSILLDHAEIDNIEDALIKVAEYIKAKDSSSALAELASLKNFIGHIPKKEAFSIKNIF